MSQNRLKEALKENNKTATWLASRTPYKREYISRVGNYNIKNPGIDFCLRVSHALGVKIEDIFYL